MFVVCKIITLKWNSCGPYNKIKINGSLSELPAEIRVGEMVFSELLT